MSKKVISFHSKHFTETVIPMRLHQARIFRGLSLAELAEKLEISRQAVGRMEQGTLKISSNTLVKLSDILDFPIHFFSKELKLNSTESGAVFFRTRSIPQKRRDAYKMKMKLYADEVVGALQCYFDLPVLNFPQYDKEHPYEGYTVEDMEDVAMGVRNAWNIGSAPIQNLMSVMQRNGIIIFKMDLGMTDGFSQWSNGVPIVVVNEKSNYFRTRFSLAHELGHLLLHSDVKDEDSAKREIEAEANAFAGSFLMPDCSFQKDVRATMLNDLVPLKKRWGVSIAAIVYRLHKLGYVTEERYKGLNVQLSSRGWKKSEPFDNIYEDEEPRLFRECVKILLEESIVSKADLVEQIALSPEDMADAFYLPREFFTEKDIVPKLNVDLK